MDDTGLKFRYAILYVRDVEATVQFYERAFGFERRFVHESGYGELNTGETTLAFASFQLAQSNEVGFEGRESLRNLTDMEIAFMANDVEKAFHCAVAAGAEIVKKPAQKPWGQLVGYVRDPNGFLIEICSPVAS